MTMLLACLLSFAQAATVQIGGGGSTVTGGSCAADTYATSISSAGAPTCATVTNAGLAGSIASSKLADTMTKVVATAEATGQSANISATTFYTTPAATHQYRLSCTMELVGTASVSSTLGRCGGVFTSNDTNFAVSLVAIGSVNSTANVLGTYGNGVIVFKAKASTAVQYQTFSYASSGSPAMTYTTRFVLEQLD